MDLLDEEEEEEEGRREEMVKDDPTTAAIRRVRTWTTAPLLLDIQSLMR